jgi:hypothetical protein
MGTAHYFHPDNPAAIIRKLTANGYTGEETHHWAVYSKVLSDALEKNYGFWDGPASRKTVRVRVTYQLLKGGKPLQGFVNELAKLNANYLRALPVWKIERKIRRGVRDKRSQTIQHFLAKHHELIRCFEYPGDDLLTEGNHSFNFEVAASVTEQRICFDFVKALLAARNPFGIERGRRKIDKPSLQRNGWIKRTAEMHRKWGWRARAIAREIQKELREGTWNERSRLQYNLADNTICKIAGIKLTSNSLMN